MANNKAIISLIPLFIFLWEHIALANNISFKPSIFIDGITKCSQIMWKGFGIGFAYLGTYYEYLHLDKIHTTCRSLYLSLYGLYKSVYYFELGFDSVASLYDHPYMIVTCALTSITVISSIFIWYKIPQKLYHRHMK